MIQPKRVLLTQHGDPLKSLRVESFPMPEPFAGEVLIRLLAAPIHPSDLGYIAGTYGRSPEKLPVVAGREGVGEVIGLGDGVDATWLGQKVRMPEGAVWQEAAVEKVEKLYALPEGIGVDSAAMAFINPATAWRLLYDFVDLKDGDWIVQNAGNSAVGRCVIQLARDLGINTLSILREEALIGELKALGATEVVLETEADWEQFKDREFRLALNSVGGQSAIQLIKMLASGGCHVTFGGMTAEAVRFPTRELIFKGVTLSGFWLDAWLQTAEYGAHKSMYDRIFDLIKQERMTIPVEKKYPLEDVLSAIKHASANHRRGKILLQSHWWPELHA